MIKRATSVGLDGTRVTKRVEVDPAAKATSDLAVEVLGMCVIPYMASRESNDCMADVLALAECHPQLEERVALLGIPEKMSSIHDNVQLFAEVCMHRCPRTIAWMAHKWMWDIGYLEKVTINSLHVACRRGDLRAVKWIVGRRLKKVSDGADKRSYYEFVFSCDEDPKRRYMFTAFRCACEEGRLEVARWVSERIDFVIGDFKCVVKRDVFREVCSRGHLDLAKWLATDFKIIVGDVQSSFCLTLINTCGNGRLQIAKWLTETFGLTPEDARSWDNSAIRQACGNGHIQTARWLVDMFGLKVEDVRCCDDEAFVVACMRGHVDVTTWMADAFGITTTDVARGGYNVFSLTCECGQLTAATWLADRFAIDADGARSRRNRALRKACRYGRLGVARWLVARFGLTAEDSRSKGNYALVKACKCGHADVAEWLVHTFGLGEGDAGVPNSLSRENFKGWFG